jgi:ribosome maturation factor RimP
MSTTQTDRLRGLLEPLAQAAGLDLEEVAVAPAGKRRMLRVVIDSDTGVQLDAVAELSREVSAALDKSDVMGGAPYVLEVTSPGVDRPLTESRHFARNTGRLVKAQLAEGGELIGRITAVDEAGLELEVPGVKGRKPTSRRLAFAEIARARVEVEFGRQPKDDGITQDDDAESASADIDESTEEA